MWIDALNQSHLSVFDVMLIQYDKLDILAIMFTRLCLCIFCQCTCSLCGVVVDASGPLCFLFCGGHFQGFT